MAMPHPSQEGKSAVAIRFPQPNLKNMIAYQTPLTPMQRYKIQQKVQKTIRQKVNKEKLSNLGQRIQGVPLHYWWIN